MQEAAVWWVQQQRHCDASQWQAELTYLQLKELFTQVPYLILSLKNGLELERMDPRLVGLGTVQSLGVTNAQAHPAACHVCQFTPFIITEHLLCARHCGFGHEQTQASSMDLGA